MIRDYSKKYIAEFVYGATDGTVTTFAIISGVVGANLSPLIVLVLGISNVLADGFSMAASNYLSAKSDRAIGGESSKQPVKTSLVTFLSFVSIGTIPLLPFILAFIITSLSDIQFMLSFILTGVAFLVIGAIRGRVTGEHPGITALETLAVGGIAAGIAYGVGYALHILIGL